MLVDNVTIEIKAGDGGSGASSFLRNGLTSRGGPDGGNGGNGGNIYFQGTNNLNDLRMFRFKKKLRAEDGISGKDQKRHGKNASDMTILVPLGTKITDTTTNNIYEIRDTVTSVLLARGGRGGLGNTEFKTSVNQAPTYAENGTPGERKKLFLELKLIAEIGLIGLPNAGKSSLLAALTNANPKIGDYPFTTLEPNIGMMGIHPIADIPGLIEGASRGRGLGVSFLKHIEKTKIIFHCIESNAKDAPERYETVRLEFEQYNAELLNKPEIILLTKSDLADEKTLRKNTDIFTKMGKKVLYCSVLDENTLHFLKEETEKLL
jgi:GTPase